MAIGVPGYSQTNSGYKSGGHSTSSLQQQHRHLTSEMPSPYPGPPSDKSDPEKLQSDYTFGHDKSPRQEPSLLRSQICQQRSISISDAGLLRSQSTDMLQSGIMGEKKRNKLGYHRTSVACNHCRRRKIRCIPSPSDPQARCANCIRLKKECSFIAADQQQTTSQMTDLPTVSQSPSPGPDLSLGLQRAYPPFTIPGTGWPQSLMAAPEAEELYAPVNTTRPNHHPQDFIGQTVSSYMPTDIHPFLQSRTTVMNEEWQARHVDTSIDGYNPEPPISAPWTPARSDSGSREDLRWGPAAPIQSISYNGDNPGDPQQAHYASISEDGSQRRRGSAFSIVNQPGLVPLSSMADSQSPLKTGQLPSLAHSRTLHQPQQQLQRSFHENQESYAAWLYQQSVQGPQTLLDDASGPSANTAN